MTDDIDVKGLIERLRISRCYVRGPGDIGYDDRGEHDKSDGKPVGSVEDERREAATALESLSAERDRLDAGRREAVEYATRLAQVLHDRHFRKVAQWEPSDDLVGILMQIDNMTAGLSRVETAETQFKPDYLCPDGCVAQDALKEQLEARKQDHEKSDRLRKDNVRLREAARACVIMFGDEDPDDDWTAIRKAREALSATALKAIDSGEG